MFIIFSPLFILFSITQVLVRDFHLIFFFVTIMYIKLNKFINSYQLQVIVQLILIRTQSNEVTLCFFSINPISQVLASFTTRSQLPLLNPMRKHKRSLLLVYIQCATMGRNNNYISVEVEIPVN